MLLASTTLVAAGVFASTTAGAAAPAPKERAPKAVVAAAQQADRDRGHVPEETWDLALKRQAQKEAAIQRLIQGKKPFKGNGKGQRVPLTLEGTDRVFVILAEFSDHPHPSYCSAVAVEGQPPPCAFPSDGTPQTYDGPEHNAIPEPDRAVDNSTLWQADYNRAHYEDMYFNRMKEYYETQSSGRYSIAGEVTDWVRVPFNEARYGRDFCGGIVCNNTWFLLRDAMSVWTQDRLDEGMEMPEIQEYLATFDVQDRYDLDNDEIYDEPDGAIDHMQIVHAGGDQAAGDPSFGTDAIWSHRWRAALTSRSDGLPGFEVGSGGPTGDTTVPNNPTGMWVSDYTIQPENGGLGVFAHEYAHDLGLPDLYDTSGNTGGAENNTAFWTLMSSGANIGDGGPDGIGDAPTDMGTWELLQLGWLEPQGGNGPFYDTVPFGETKTAVLSNNTPAYDNGLQSLIASLPSKTQTISVGAPFEGSWQYYSDQGNSMTTRMVKTGVSGTNLTAKVRYEIEADWDFAFVEASTDNGATWQQVHTNLSGAGNESGFNGQGNGISGVQATWTDLTATLPAGTNAVRFRYRTDEAFVMSGFRVDNIAIDGTVIGTAETADEGWTLDGFLRAQTTAEKQVNHAYIVENRRYDGYDESLRTAYNFSFGLTRPDWVETYPYMEGALIWYWDEEYDDNNVGEHPGHGLLLPVDAHPGLSHWPDGTLMRNRIQSYDSTFGLKPTKKVTLHREVLDGENVVTQTGVIKSQRAVSVFDDTAKWWYPTDGHEVLVDDDGDPTTPMVLAHPGRYQPGWYSVDVPKTGTVIEIVRTKGDTVTVMVAPKG